MIIFRGWIPFFDSAGCETEEHLASKNLLLLSQNIVVWKIWHSLEYCTKEGQLNKRKLCVGTVCVCVCVCVCGIVTSAEGVM